MRELLAIVCFLLPAASAQEFRGTILGSVRDASQAVIAGASIVVTNTATNAAVTAQTGGTFQSRTVFPNAIIPADRLNPIGVKVLSKLPAPNLNLDRTQVNTPNWTADMQFPQVTENWQLRLDQALGTRHRFFARLARPTYLGQPNPAYFAGAYSVPPNGTSNLNTDSRKHGNVILDDTVLFTPSRVGSFRLGYTRIWTYNFMPGDTENPADLGLPEAITGHQIQPAWPIFELSQEGAPFIGSRPRTSVNDIWSFINNFNALANSPFNHPSFDNPATDLTSPATFGVITGAGGTRTITFGAKLKF